MQELNKKRSCLRRSCMSGCGCLALIAILLSALLWFAGRSPSKELNRVPESFPDDIPLYDTDAISAISYASGKEKNQLLEIAAVVPRAAVNKTLDALDRRGDAASRFAPMLERIRTLANPSNIRRDTYRIEWKNLSAQPKFIAEYYRTELTKRQFAVTRGMDTDVRISFSFKKGLTEGVFLLSDDPRREGTDTLMLTVQTPTSET